MSKVIYYLLLIGGIIGIFDAGFLTVEHFQQTIPPCSVSAFADCGKVLHSSYAKLFGIPLALIGLIHYTLLTFTTIAAIITKKDRWIFALISLILTGFVASIYFVYIQLAILNAFCLYCMVSALNSFLLFTLVQLTLRAKQKKFLLTVIAFCYQKIIKPFFFTLDPELIHNIMIKRGELFGRFFISRSLMSLIFKYENKTILSQQVANITFSNPVGLSAGFDYEARLTQVLPAIGFGFETIGTITNKPYAGNPRPMLGRLPNSKSLMVNKGFKNDGIEETLKRMEDKNFSIPIGISIGRTNLASMNQNQSVMDIIEAFKKAEKSKVTHRFYELNISCPNLYGNVTFYNSQKLKQLLTALDNLKLTRPVFIKMPIEKSDREILTLLQVIVKHNITGVIFGNLQKNRTDPTLDQNEVKKFEVGNFSGKPTYKRSNELIALTYKNYKNKLVIIGCGGIFSAEDAYTKICLGASIVQLITGMIYQGPQLISQINIGLTELLKKDGFTHITQAIGSKNQTK